MKPLSVVMAFAALLASDGSLTWSTFLGGGGSDVGEGIAVDASGNAYVTGQAGGSFPTTSSAFQTTPKGTGYEAFWLRDYEYTLEGSIDSYSDKELIDACRLFVRSLRADGAGVNQFPRLAAERGVAQVELQTHLQARLAGQSLDPRCLPAQGLEEPPLRRRGRRRVRVAERRDEQRPVRVSVVEEGLAEPPRSLLG